MTIEPLTSAGNRLKTSLPGATRPTQIPVGHRHRARNPVDNRGFDQAAASKTMLADESHSSPGSTPVRAWLSGRADQYADDGGPHSHNQESSFTA